MNSHIWKRTTSDGTTVLMYGRLVEKVNGRIAVETKYSNRERFEINVNFPLFNNFDEATTYMDNLPKWTRCQNKVKGKNKTFDKSEIGDWQVE